MQEEKGRDALHQRFKEVFALLEQNEQIVRRHREKGFSALAEKLFGDRRYGSLLNQFLQDKRQVSFEQAQTFAQIYGLNEAYLLFGDGPIFEKAHQRSLTGNAQFVGGQRGNILFSNIEALASSAIDIDLREENQWFSIPGLRGQDYVAFYISGNSMSPTIAAGDMVICRPIESFEYIQDNEVYALVLQNAVHVKRVQKIYEKSKLKQLKLISDNHLEHDPFYIDLPDLRKLLKVERRLSSL